MDGRIVDTELAARPELLTMSKQPGVETRFVLLTLDQEGRAQATLVPAGLLDNELLMDRQISGAKNLRSRIVRSGPDEALNGAIERFIAGSSDWNGADSCYIREVRNGEGQLSGHVMMGSDTFLGPIAPDGSRGNEIVNNSFLFMGIDGNFQMISPAGTDGRPAPLVAGENYTYYWMGGSHITHRNTLDIIFLGMHAAWNDGREGEVAFGDAIDFGKLRIDNVDRLLVRFDPGTLEKLDTTPLPCATDVHWGSWVEPDVDGYTYVYGAKEDGTRKTMHIARVEGDDLRQSWEFYDGQGWSADEANAVEVMEGVANEYSVTRLDDENYLLVTFDTRTVFSPDIVGYLSKSPTGPFIEPTLLYRTTEGGAVGKFKSSQVSTYNAHLIPDLSSGGVLRVVYSTNSSMLDETLRVSGIYRPRSVEIELPWPGLNMADREPPGWVRGDGSAHREWAPALEPADARTGPAGFAPESPSAAEPSWEPVGDGSVAPRDGRAALPEEPKTLPRGSGLLPTDGRSGGFATQYVGADGSPRRAVVVRSAGTAGDSLDGSAPVPTGGVDGSGPNLEVEPGGCAEWVAEEVDKVRPEGDKLPDWADERDEQGRKLYGNSDLGVQRKFEAELRLYGRRLEDLGPREAFGPEKGGAGEYGRLRAYQEAGEYRNSLSAVHDAVESLGDGCSAVVVERYAQEDELGLGAHAYRFRNENGTVLVDDPAGNFHGVPFAIDGELNPLIAAELIGYRSGEVTGVWAILTDAQGQPVDAEGNPARLTSGELEALEPISEHGESIHIGTTPAEGSGLSGGEVGPASTAHETEAAESGYEWIRRNFAEVCTGIFENNREFFYDNYNSEEVPAEAVAPKPFRHKQIDQILDYLITDEHWLLDDTSTEPVRRRFTPSLAVYEAIRRLTEGDYDGPYGTKQHALDLMLFARELVEESLMEDDLSPEMIALRWENGDLSHFDAHTAADEVAGWQAARDAFENDPDSWEPFENDRDTSWPERLLPNLTNAAIEASRNRQQRSFDIMREIADALGIPADITDIVRLERLVRQRIEAALADEVDPYERPLIDPEEARTRVGQRWIHDGLIAFAHRSWDASVVYSIAHVEEMRLRGRTPDPEVAQLDQMSPGWPVLEKRLEEIGTRFLGREGLSPDDVKAAVDENFESMERWPESVVREPYTIDSDSFDRYLDDLIFAPGNSVVVTTGLHESPHDVWEERDRYRHENWRATYELWSTYEGTDLSRELDARETERADSGLAKLRRTASGLGLIPDEIVQPGTDLLEISRQVPDLVNLIETWQTGEAKAIVEDASSDSESRRRLARLRAYRRYRVRRDSLWGQLRIHSARAESARMRGDYEGFDQAMDDVAPVWSQAVELIDEYCESLDPRPTTGPYDTDPATGLSSYYDHARFDTEYASFRAAGARIDLGQMRLELPAAGFNGRPAGDGLRLHFAVQDAEPQCQAALTTVRLRGRRARAAVDAIAVTLGLRRPGTILPEFGAPIPDVRTEPRNSRLPESMRPPPERVLFEETVTELRSRLEERNDPDIGPARRAMLREIGRSLERAVHDMYVVMADTAAITDYPGLGMDLTRPGDIHDHRLGEHTGSVESALMSEAEKVARCAAAAALEHATPHAADLERITRRLADLEAGPELGTSDEEVTGPWHIDTWESDVMRRLDAAAERPGAPAGVVAEIRRDTYYVLLGCYQARREMASSAGIEADLETATAQVNRVLAVLYRSAVERRGAALVEMRSGKVAESVAHALTAAENELSLLSVLADPRQRDGHVLGTADTGWRPKGPAYEQDIAAALAEVIAQFTGDVEAVSETIAGFAAAELRRADGRSIGFAPDDLREIKMYLFGSATGLGTVTTWLRLAADDYPDDRQRLSDIEFLDRVLAEMRSMAVHTANGGTYTPVHTVMDWRPGYYPAAGRSAVEGGLRGAESAVAQYLRLGEDRSSSAVAQAFREWARGSRELDEPVTVSETDFANRDLGDPDERDKFVTAVREHSEKVAVGRAPVVRATRDYYRALARDTRRAGDDRAPEGAVEETFRLFGHALLNDRAHTALRRVWTLAATLSGRLLDTRSGHSVLREDPAELLGHIRAWSGLPASQWVDESLWRTREFAMTEMLHPDLSVVEQVSSRRELRHRALRVTLWLLQEHYGALSEIYEHWRVWSPTIVGPHRLARAADGKTAREMVGRLSGELAELTDSRREAAVGDMRALMRRIDKVGRSRKARRTEATGRHGVAAKAAAYRRLLDEQTEKIKSAASSAQSVGPLRWDDLQDWRVASQLYWLRRELDQLIFRAFCARAESELLAGKPERAAAFLAEAQIAWKDFVTAADIRRAKLRDVLVTVATEVLGKDAVRERELDDREIRDLHRMISEEISNRIYVATSKLETEGDIENSRGTGRFGIAQQDANRLGGGRFARRTLTRRVTRLAELGFEAAVAYNENCRIEVDLDRFRGDLPYARGTDYLRDPIAPLIASQDSVDSWSYIRLAAAVRNRGWLQDHYADFHEAGSEPRYDLVVAARSSFHHQVGDTVKELTSRADRGRRNLEEAIRAGVPPVRRHLLHELSHRAEQAAGQAKFARQWAEVDRVARRPNPDAENTVVSVKSLEEMGSGRISSFSDLRPSQVMAGAVDTWRHIQGLTASNLTYIDQELERIEEELGLPRAGDIVERAQTCADRLDGELGKLEAELEKSASSAANPIGMIAYRQTYSDRHQLRREVKYILRHANLAFADRHADIAGGDSQESAADSYERAASELWDALCTDAENRRAGAWEDIRAVQRELGLPESGATVRAAAATVSRWIREQKARGASNIADGPDPNFVRGVVVGILNEHSDATWELGILHADDPEEPDSSELRLPIFGAVRDFPMDAEVQAEADADFERIRNDRHDIAAIARTIREARDERGKRIFPEADTAEILGNLGDIKNHIFGNEDQRLDPDTGLPEDGPRLAQSHPDMVTVWDRLVRNTYETDEWGIDLTPAEQIAQRRSDVEFLRHEFYESLGLFAGWDLERAHDEADRLAPWQETRFDAERARALADSRSAAATEHGLPPAEGLPGAVDRTVELLRQLPAGKELYHTIREGERHPAKEKKYSADIVERAAEGDVPAAEAVERLAESAAAEDLAASGRAAAARVHEMAPLANLRAQAADQAHIWGARFLIAAQAREFGAPGARPLDATGADIATLRESGDTTREAQLRAAERKYHEFFGRALAESERHTITPPGPELRARAHERAIAELGDHLYRMVIDDELCDPLRDHATFADCLRAHGLPPDLGDEETRALVEELARTLRNPVPDHQGYPARSAAELQQWLEQQLRFVSTADRTASGWTRYVPAEPATHATMRSSAWERTVLRRNALNRATTFAEKVAGLPGSDVDPRIPDSADERNMLRDRLAVAQQRVESEIAEHGWGILQPELARLRRRELDLRHIRDLLADYEEATAAADSRYDGAVRSVANKLLTEWTGSIEGATVHREQVAIVPGEPGEMWIVAKPGDHQWLRTTVDEPPEGTRIRCWEIDLLDDGAVFYREIDDPIPSDDVPSVGGWHPHLVDEYTAARVDELRDQLPPGDPRDLVLDRRKISFGSRPSHYEPSRDRVVLDAGRTDAQLLKELAAAGIARSRARQRVSYGILLRICRELGISPETDDVAALARVVQWQITAAAEAGRTVERPVIDPEQVLVRARQQRLEDRYADLSSEAEEAFDEYRSALKFETEFRGEIPGPDLTEGRKDTPEQYVALDARTVERRMVNLGWKNGITGTQPPEIVREIQNRVEDTPSDEEQRSRSRPWARPQLFADFLNDAVSLGDHYRDFDAADRAGDQAQFWQTVYREALYLWRAHPTGQAPEADPNVGVARPLPSLLSLDATRRVAAERVVRRLARDLNLITDTPGGGSPGPWRLVDLIGEWSAAEAEAVERDAASESGWTRRRARVRDERRYLVQRDTLWARLRIHCSEAELARTNGDDPAFELAMREVGTVWTAIEEFIARRSAFLAEQQHPGQDEFTTRYLGFGIDRVRVDLERMRAELPYAGHAGTGSEDDSLLKEALEESEKSGTAVLAAVVERGQAAYTALEGAAIANGVREQEISPARKTLENFLDIERDMRRWLAEQPTSSNAVELDEVARALDRAAHDFYRAAADFVAVRETPDPAANLDYPSGLDDYTLEDYPGSLELAMAFEAERVASNYGDSVLIRGEAGPVGPAVDDRQADLGVPESGRPGEGDSAGDGSADSGAVPNPGDLAGAGNNPSVAPLWDVSEGDGNAPAGDYDAPDGDDGPEGGDDGPDDGDDHGPAGGIGGPDDDGSGNTGPGDSAPDSDGPRDSRGDRDPEAGGSAAQPASEGAGQPPGDNSRGFVYSDRPGPDNQRYGGPDGRRRYVSDQLDLDAAELVRQIAPLTGEHIPGSPLASLYRKAGSAALAARGDYAAQAELFAIGRDQGLTSPALQAGRRAGRSAIREIIAARPAPGGGTYAQRHRAEWDAYSHEDPARPVITVEFATEGDTDGTAGVLPPGPGRSGGYRVSVRWDAGDGPAADHPQADDAVPGSERGHTRDGGVDRGADHGPASGRGRLAGERDDPSLDTSDSEAAAARFAAAVGQLRQLGVAIPWQDTAAPDPRRMLELVAAVETRIDAFEDRPGESAADILPRTEWIDRRTARTLEDLRYLQREAVGQAVDLRTAAWRSAQLGAAGPSEVAAAESALNEVRELAMRMALTRSESGAHQLTRIADRLGLEPAATLAALGAAVESELVGRLRAENDVELRTMMSWLLAAAQTAVAEYHRGLAEFAQFAIADERRVIGAGETPADAGRALAEVATAEANRMSDAAVNTRMARPGGVAGSAELSASSPVSDPDAVAGVVAPDDLESRDISLPADHEPLAIDLLLERNRLRYALQVLDDAADFLGIDLRGAEDGLADPSGAAQRLLAEFDLRIRDWRDELAAPMPDTDISTVADDGFDTVVDGWVNRKARGDLYDTLRWRRRTIEAMAAYYSAELQLEIWDGATREQVADSGFRDWQRLWQDAARDRARAGLERLCALVGRLREGAADPQGSEVGAETPAQVDAAMELLSSDGDQDRLRLIGEELVDAAKAQLERRDLAGTAPDARAHLWELFDAAIEYHSGCVDFHRAVEGLPGLDRDRSGFVDTPHDPLGATVDDLREDLGQAAALAATVAESDLREIHRKVEGGSLGPDNFDELMEVLLGTIEGPPADAEPIDDESATDEPIRPDDFPESGDFIAAIRGGERLPADDVPGDESDSSAAESADDDSILHLPAWKDRTTLFYRAQDNELQQRIREAYRRYLLAQADTAWSHLREHDPDDHAEQDPNHPAELDVKQTRRGVLHQWHVVMQDYSATWAESRTLMQSRRNAALKVLRDHAADAGLASTADLGDIDRVRIRTSEILEVLDTEARRLRATLTGGSGDPDETWRIAEVAGTRDAHRVEQLELDRVLNRRQEVLVQFSEYTAATETSNRLTAELAAARNPDAAQSAAGDSAVSGPREWVDGQIQIAATERAAAVVRALNTLAVSIGYPAGHLPEPEAEAEEVHAAVARIRNWFGVRRDNLLDGVRRDESGALDADTLDEELERIGWALDRVLVDHAWARVGAQVTDTEYPEPDTHSPFEAAMAQVRRLTAAAKDAAESRRSAVREQLLRLGGRLGVEFGTVAREEWLRLGDRHGIDVDYMLWDLDNLAEADLVDDIRHWLISNPDDQAQRLLDRLEVRNQLVQSDAAQLRGDSTAARQVPDDEGQHWGAAASSLASGQPWRFFAPAVEHEATGMPRTAEAALFRSAWFGPYRIEFPFGAMELLHRTRSGREILEFFEAHGMPHNVTAVPDPVEWVMEVAGEIQRTTIALDPHTPTVDPDDYADRDEYVATALLQEATVAAARYRLEEELRALGYRHFTPDPDRELYRISFTRALTGLGAQESDSARHEAHRIAVEHLATRLGRTEDLGRTGSQRHGEYWNAVRSVRTGNYYVPADEKVAGHFRAAGGGGGGRPGRPRGAPPGGGEGPAPEGGGCSHLAAGYAPRAAPRPPRAAGAGAGGHPAGPRPPAHLCSP
ncbi:DUF4185 domain-containing protein, partial [Nocardia carnea]|uniref:DUF4185 domain-containing protein n=1 Tax=Nocardia carnea TaxID=37328 RepID=UPI0024587B38